MDKQSLGRMGENIAANYLLSKGYRILHRRYRTKEGEVDIIAEKDGVISFVEVKTRRSLKYGAPYEAVDQRKLSHMRNVAMRYLQLNMVGEADMSFDVISIVIMEQGVKIEHIKEIL